MTNIKSSNEVFGISKDDAYEIIGGYKAADGETLAAAIKIMEEEALSSDIAARLLTLYKSNMSLKSIDFNEISDAQLEKGLDNAIEFTRSEDDYIRQIFSDNTNNSLIINTKLIDTNGDEASVQAADNGALLLARVAAEEVKRKLITGQLASVEDAQNALNSQFASKYFDLRSEALKDVSGADIEDASDAKKTVHVLAKKVSEMFEKAKKAVKKIDEKLEKRVNSSKSTAVKAKFRKFKTLIVAGFMAFSGITMSSCTGDKQRAPEQQEVVDTPLNMKKTNVQPKTISLQDSIQSQKQDTVLNDTIKADTIKTDAFVYTSKDKGLLIDYINKSFPNLGYDGAVEKIQENIDKFSGITENPDVILNAYRFGTSAPSWEVKHGEVAKVARQLGKWLEPCEGETAEFPQNISAMFIEQFSGNLDRRVCGYDNCDDKMMVENQSKVQKDEIAPKEEAKDSVETVKAQSFEMSGEDAVELQDNVKTNQVEADLTAHEYNGNENLTDDKDLGEVSIDQANREVKGADEQKVLVEQRDTTVQSKAAAFTADGTIVADDADSLTATKFNGNENLTNGLAQGSVDLSKGVDVSVKDQNVLVEATAKKEDVAPAAPSFTMDEEEVADDADDLAVAPVAAAQTVADTKATETSAKEETSEIIFGTEGVEIGTPSAGYVAERGGYKNSGLTKDQYNRTFKYFENKYGKGAVEAYCAKINANDGLLLQNGQIGAGWVDMELLFAWMNTENWSSNNPNNKNADQTFVTINNTLEQYFDEKCGKDSLTQDETALILEKFSNVTNTSRIFGIKGDKAIRTISQRATDDCDKPSTHVYENTGSAHSASYGQPLARLFRKIQTAVAQAFTFDGEEIADVKDNITTIKVEQEINVAEYNGNEGLTSGKKIRDNVPVAKANRKVKGKKHKVLVEQKSQEVAFNNSKKSKTLNLKIQRARNRYFARLAKEQQARAKRQAPLRDQQNEMA